MVFHEAAALGQVAVEWVALWKLRVICPESRALEQILDVAQTLGAVGYCLVAGGIDRAERVRLSQADQAHDRAQADRSVGGHDAPGPMLGGRS